MCVNKELCCLEGSRLSNTALMDACPLVSVFHQYYDLTRTCIKTTMTYDSGAFDRAVGERVDVQECCDKGKAIIPPVTVAMPDDEKFILACPVSSYNNLKSLEFPERKSVWPNEMQLDMIADDWNLNGRVADFQG